MKFDRRLTDEIYTSDTVRLGKNAFQAMRETVDITTFWIFRTNWIRGRIFCTRRTMTG
ncbi:Uncharacterised protein [uncultured Faecalibacterium sp.]|nr:Uncharacterised protein [uncultured Faecalibacterium sp.]